MDRRLAAILSADVEGYSRLMEGDEEDTVRTLTLYRELMASLIEQHRGRVVDSPGDNVLAEFGSVVDAVQGAVSIQIELNSRNLELEPERRMNFRIGVNLGDVVADGSRIYGDGVNIAARVESLAEAGGICISGTVHEHIRNKLPLGYVSLGEQSVKNISQPIRVYRVQGQADAGPPQPAAEEFEAIYPVPRSRVPAIVLAMAAGLVLMFTASVVLLMWGSGDPSPEPPSDVASRGSPRPSAETAEQAPAVPNAASPAPQAAPSQAARPALSARGGVTLAFATAPDSAAVGVMNFKALVPDADSSWMTEAIRDNLNGQLHKVPGIEVYSKEFIDFLVEDGKTNELKVAHDLGISKMISGSYIATGDRLRIEAHVVNVRTGLLEASDRVEGPLSDFFAMQTRLAFKIAEHLDVRVSLDDRAAIASAPASSNIDAYKLLLQAEDETGEVDPSLEDLLESPQSRRQNPLDSPEPTFRWRWDWLGVGTAWADGTPTAELEIREVLERYRQAYESKDLDLLSSVYTDLTPKQRKARLKYFQNTDDLAVAINDVRIAVRGDEAIASYTRADEFKDRKTGEVVKLDVRLTKKLHRTDGSWKLVGGRK